MEIKIGSKNPVKCKAVKEVILSCENFKDIKFDSVDVASGVPDQPIGLDQTIQGAKNRALGAFYDCQYSIGLESGLIPVNVISSGYMNLSVCSIYDGIKHHIGLGPAFELPEDIADMIINQNFDLSEAVYKSGLSDNPNIGYSKGIIGILTKGRVSRMEYCKPAISMALASLRI